MLQMESMPCPNVIYVVPALLHSSAEIFLVLIKVRERRDCVIHLSGQTAEVIFDGT